MKVTKDSHTDHVSAEQLTYMLKCFADAKGFFIAEVTIPDELGTVSCGLYGPAMGDPLVSEEEVRYVIREGRKCSSRVIPRHVGFRLTNKAVVIAGPSEDGKEPCVLYTVYGGPLAPREPGDKDIPDWDGIVLSRKFWSEHALAL